jgi:serine/threonine-protein kinase
MSRANLVNTTIGEYRVVDFLGAGGMGEVYRAVHSKIGRVVAIKLLTQTARNPNFVERFLNEARIQATLQHPNIVTLYDFLEFNGQPCIIMEYIEGQELDDRIRACGSLPLSEALRIFQSVVEAIEYVHNQGIVHRDIKSNNIKISNAGQVKVLDFGIAKSGTTPQLTMTGAFIGTLQYLSPEQITGGTADYRSDIWALGVLLYEMVTGKLPFQAITLGELCEKIVKTHHAPPTSLNASVPREVEAIITRCLKKNPQERYNSASELLYDVRRASGTLSGPQPALDQHQRISAPNPSQPISGPYPTHPIPGPRPAHPVSDQHRMPAAPEKPSPQPKSNVGLIAVSVAAFVLIVAGIVYVIVGMDGSSTGGSSTSLSNQSSSRASSNMPLRTVKIDAVGGQAEISINGQKVGTTPYQFQAHVKEQFDVTLHREGFVDKQIRISVSDTTNEYMYTLEKRH